MEKNKKKLGLIIFIVVLILIIVIGIVLLVVKKNNITNEELGNVKIHLSLEGKGQQSIEEQIIKNLENGKHKLEEAQVYVNPYGSSPLSALITFYTEKEDCKSEKPLNLQVLCPCDKKHLHFIDFHTHSW
jgi:hypothetical protein